MKLTVKGQKQEQRIKQDELDEINNDLHESAQEEDRLERQSRLERSAIRLSKS